MNTLKPCPFCGNPYKDDSYDRGIVFVCEVCEYRRHFPGYIQTIESNEPVLKYRNNKGEIIKVAEPTEWFHHDAKNKAIIQMNKRLK